MNNQHNYNQAIHIKFNKLKNYLNDLEKIENINLELESG